MVKIFIGNLPQEADKEEIEALFTQHGKVTECAKYKNYAFVHMEDRKAATKAIRELHQYRLHGRPINVEPSRGNNQNPVKLHIANVEKCFVAELRELFEEYGTVTECAIIKNFAFVHMANSDEAMDAIKGLDNHEFQGKRIHVQISKSHPRGGHEDYPPPPPERGDYWPPHCPGEGPKPPFRGRMPDYPALPPPPPPLHRRAPYPERGYDMRDGYGMVDFYEKYRARPYGASGYDDQQASNIPPPPPPPSALVRERLAASAALDMYQNQPLPPPPPPPPSSYYARDRSPIMRGPPLPSGAMGNGFSYQRSRLSPVSRPVYGTPRPGDPYVDRVPPPPPRYSF